jgi:copper chaperone CopZ
MNTVKIVLSILLVSFMSYMPTMAQEKSASKTETMKVLGNCEMCKSRIEKAARVDGVENATWDAKSKLLTIKYSPAKTGTDVVAKKVAAVGHDTEKFKADNKTYDALPACCKYDRNHDSKSPEQAHTHDN